MSVIEEGDDCDRRRRDEKSVEALPSFPDGVVSERTSRNRGRSFSLRKCQPWMSFICFFLFIVSFLLFMMRILKAVIFFQKTYRILLNALSSSWCSGSALDF